MLRLEHVLYSVGGLFAAAAIIYFSWEYLDLLPRIAKTVLLGLVLFAFLFLAYHFQERDI